MHPKGQQKLLDALLEISKARQVFVTTHSPYFLNTSYLKNIGIHIFQRKNGKNQVESSKVNYLFPWSPTWGEINYRAYNLVTVDFHNELFGYIQETIANCKNLKEFDKWLEQECLVVKDNKWTKDGLKFECVTLLHFIRNHIHHPENVFMKANSYTELDLEKSINLMIEIIRKYELEKSLREVS